MVSHARAVGPKSSAYVMPATRPIIVRDARPADACSPTVLFPACYTRTGRARSTNLRPSGSDDVSFSKKLRTRCRSGAIPCDYRSKIEIQPHGGGNDAVHASHLRDRRTQAKPGRVRTAPSG